MHEAMVPSARPTEGWTTSRCWTLVGIATVVAALLRLPFLGHQSLWFDEVYTRQIMGQSSMIGLWHHLRATESTPPLYYIIGWLLGAQSAAAMRVVPALALTASVPVGYLAFRRFLGQRPAVATAAILAVSPMLVAYSTDARSYGLFVLTALLSVWSLGAVLDDPTGRRYALWALAADGVLWTHYFGAFLVAAEVLVLLATRPEARRRTVAWSMVALVPVVPLVPLALHQAADGRAEFIAGLTLRSRVEATVRELAMGANVPRTAVEAAGLALWAGSVAAGAWLAIRASRARPLLVLAAVTAGLPLLLAVTGVDDRFYSRNLLPVLPLAAAVAAPVMLRGRGVPLAAYLALSLLTSVWVATDWRYEQLDWRDAIAVAERVDRRAPVVAFTRLSEPVVRTYLGRPPAAPGAVRAKRAWLIVEPTRPAGHRGLVPAPVPELPGWRAERELEVRGFRLLLEVTPPAARAAGATLAAPARAAG